MTKKTADRRSFFARYPFLDIPDYIVYNGKNEMEVFP